MATLEKIRNRIGVLAAILIGFSLLAFILGDLLTSGQSIFRQSQMNVGVINGNSIRYEEYNALVEEMSNIYKANMNTQALDETMMENVREQVWQQLLQENILGPENKKLGIAVSSEELYNMVAGPNPHPFVRQIFVNPQTRQFDPSFAIQFLKAFNAGELSEEQAAQWKFYENELYREKLAEKYNTLVAKGMYVTSLQTREGYKEMSRLANVRFIGKRYSEVSDSLIKVTDKDLRAYYNDHKTGFQQDASFDLEYVSFDIVPSEADFAAAQKWINDIREDFSAADDPAGFVNANSDESYVDRYFKKEELTPPIDSFAFAAKPGTTFGPFFTDNSFRLVRLIETGLVPDSVRARHILVQPAAQTTEAMNRAKKLADSLEQVIRKGADFTALAMRFSADEGSKTKGGDLGWFTEGRMIKPFSDAAFSMQKNEVKVVETQYGYHVLQVTDVGPKVKKAKIAQLVRRVEASKETYERIYEQANRFAFTNNTGEKFEKAVKEQNLVPRYAMSIKPSDTRISGLESPREIIRWAMEAKVNDVSSVMQAGNRFIVARVTAVRKAGIAPFEQVKQQIEIAVSRIKKGEYLAEQIQKKIADHPTLDQLALAENLPVNEANNVSFTATTIAGAGFEPALTGTIAAWPANKLSKPVIGNNGVYVFEITSVQEPAEPDQMALTMQKSRMESMYQMRAGYESFEALKKLTKIEDNRARFY